MEEKQIRMLYDKGVLTGSSVVQAVMQDGYWIHFKEKGSPNTPIILMSQRGDRRTFKTLDAANRLLKSIGFRSYTVTLANVAS